MDNVPQQVYLCLRDIITKQVSILNALTVDMALHMFHKLHVLASPAIAAWRLVLILISALQTRSSEKSTKPLPSGTGLY